jgi:hypothetical protein
MKKISAKTPKFITTTSAALKQEYHLHGWQERLSKCTPVRVDDESSSPSRFYRSQKLVKYFEGAHLIAFVIYYELHDGTVSTVPRMLLIDGIRHIAL